MKTIKIKCKGASLLPIDAILEFQGNLKKLSKKNLEKLKKNILINGFIAPIFVWEHEGDNLILDGHQRIASLISLRKDGYDIPLLPVDFIEAKDEREARKMLLGVTSQYGEFDKNILEEWIDEIDDEIMRFVDNEIKLEINDDEKEEEINGIDYKEKIQIIIDFENISEAEIIYNKLKNEGLKCKISTL